MKTKRNFLSRRSDLIMIFHKCALNTSITNKLCFIENTYNIFINTSSIISNTTMRHQCVSFNVCYSINLSNAHARLQITANCVALVVVCRSECERYKIGNMFVEYKNMQMNRAQTNGGSNFKIAWTLHFCVFCCQLSHICIIREAFGGSGVSDFIHPRVYFFC